MSDAPATSDDKCNTECPTDPSLMCGSSGYVSVYKITNPGSRDASAVPVPPACQTYPLCEHPVCDVSKSISERVASLVDDMSVEEKVRNLVDASAGVKSLGLPPHAWWNEGLHGVGFSPGVLFAGDSEPFGHATSFPLPILTAASFDDDLFNAIGQVIGKEGRAFSNYGYAGFNFWTPNMNAFRDPRWGRGQETPGEDVLVVSNYVQSYVTGLQGGDPTDKVIIAACKHFAAYDIETARRANNYNPTQQDLQDYYLPAFRRCVRDSHVGSVMCSYNSVDGIPACSSEYLLKEVLRDTWGFTDDYQFVVSDCGAVTDVWLLHNFTDTEQDAASVSMAAGTDLECGSSYLHLNGSLADNQVTQERVDEALTRLYKALFTVGYFDGSSHGSLGWSDVSTVDAQQIAYQAARAGMTLLKNDGVLPLANDKYKSVALIGPFANATTQMQGNYLGRAPFVRSPLWAFTQQSSLQVNYAAGTDINSTSDSGFAEALAAAKDSDLVIFCGGIDTTIEAEARDRVSITWPGNQLDLISQLSMLGKPLVVAQFGGGQVDDTALVNNANVNALFWAGLPGQAGGLALHDLVVGKASFAGRLPTTQYPASYTDCVSIFNINLQPNGTFPGRTYKWFTGEPVFPFGFGLHYTKFDFTWKDTLEPTYDISNIISWARSQTDGHVTDTTSFTSVNVTVENVGNVRSDYVGLLFLSSKNAGPVPRPNKSLVSYSRARDVEAGASDQLTLKLTLGSFARSDSHGNLTIFPGDYTLELDNDKSLVFDFTLTGEPVVIDSLPVPKASYDFAVPVHIQPPSDRPLGPA
ncbi:glycosyl hydrolase family 3 N terminal domain-containing protein [Colletotrichum navitas]|uniref:xylan 1,4-beta-xylosidase n=1 Tax=Colletotrichum navitas TaxID=681940 RepID=A0AAD8V222_9PEZI|nr:glycosyl hydrolase family 3 N terminal domain-containing protein [Colletotrichum navitas]KAK1585966.1 glycosyl hydrolase family 3 N terminal domain-containing protein [Colletotrichum navitas]